MVSHFQPKNSQIVAFFEKKIWGAFFALFGPEKGTSSFKTFSHFACLFWFPNFFRNFFKELIQKEQAMNLLNSCH